MTIDFFELDTREELLRQRALNIVAIYMARQRPNDPVALQTLNYLLSNGSAHAACNRAFDAVCTSDPALADQLYQATGKYFDSQS